MPRQTSATTKAPRFDLKGARESKAMTQAEVAEFFCASQASIARWESEGSLPALHRRYWELYWSGKKQKRAKPKLVPKKQPPKLHVVKNEDEEIDESDD